MSNESESWWEEGIRSSTLKPGSEEKNLKIETELPEDIALWLFIFCAQKSFNNFKLSVVFGPYHYCKQSAI